MALLQLELLANLNHTICVPSWLRLSSTGERLLFVLFTATSLVPGTCLMPEPATGWAIGHSPRWTGPESDIAFSLVPASVSGQTPGGAPRTGVKEGWEDT